MRTVCGYNPDGSKRWSENQPSAAHLSGIRGSMVQGEPGWQGIAVQKRAEARRLKRQEETDALERLRTSWRESKRRARAKVA